MINKLNKLENSIRIKKTKALIIAAGLGSRLKKTYRKFTKMYA